MIDIFLLMQKVAPISIGTVPISEENNALFCLVKAVFLVIFAKFMRSMSKLTFISVRTISIFDELFAELKFFLDRRPKRAFLTDTTR